MPSSPMVPKPSKSGLARSSGVKGWIEAARAASMAYNKALIERALGGCGATPTHAPAHRHNVAIAYRSISMAWILLLVAGLFEVGWAIGLKYTEGFTRLWPSVFTLAAMTLSVVLLGIAMRSLPVGTSYAVWVGVGAVGTALLGIVLFGESASAGRLLSLGLIVAGIVGLKLATPG
jgi:quaternary ammonium compound-resistance protein SugE